MCWTEFCTSAKSMLGVVVHAHASPGLPSGIETPLSSYFLGFLDVSELCCRGGGTESGAGLSGCSLDTFRLDGELGGWTVYPKLFLGICKLTSGLPFSR